MEGGHVVINDPEDNAFPLAGGNRLLRLPAAQGDHVPCAEQHGADDGSQRHGDQHFKEGEASRRIARRLRDTGFAPGKFHGAPSLLLP